MIPKELNAFALAMGEFITNSDPAGARKRITQENEHQLDSIADQLSIGIQTETTIDCLLESPAWFVQKYTTDNKIPLMDLLKTFHREKITRRDQLQGLATWHFPLNGALKEGPLTGYVFSIKDSIYTKYGPSTAGLLINTDKIPLSDSNMISKLKDAGAVITTKGSCPQLLFSMETQSNIFGIGRNPCDPSRTVGGSSGGDAALVKAGFVNVALGSDVGGSLRIPALLCGVHAFKPTAQRIGNECHGEWSERWHGSDHWSGPRVSPISNGQGLIPTAVGPIARSVFDLEKIMNIMASPSTLEGDISRVPMPWVTDEGSHRPKRRIGVFRGIDFCPLSRAAERALDNTIALLSDYCEDSYADYDVADLTPELTPVFDEVNLLTLQCYDQGKGLGDIIRNDVDIREPVSDVYLAQSAISGVTHEDASGRFKIIIENSQIAVAKLVDDLREEQAALYHKLMTIMNQHQVTALLCPGLPIPAPHHLQSNQLMWICAYTYMYNFLHMPCGVMTTTEVQSDEQCYEDNHNDAMTIAIKAAMVGSAGLPMGISVVAPMYKDEHAMSIMMDIERRGVKPCKVARKTGHGEDR